MAEGDAEAEGVAEPGRGRGICCGGRVSAGGARWSTRLPMAAEGWGIAEEVPPLRVAGRKVCSALVRARGRPGSDLRTSDERRDARSGRPPGWTRP